jgi:hypothetical protein
MMQDLSAFILNYWFWVSIPLWIGIPWTIKRFQAKYRDAHIGPVHDFNELDEILEDENCEKNVKRYMKKIENETESREGWFWEADFGLYFIYWLLTLISSILLIRNIIQIFQ